MFYFFPWRFNRSFLIPATCLLSLIIFCSSFPSIFQPKTDILLAQAHKSRIFGQRNPHPSPSLPPALQQQTDEVLSLLFARYCLLPADLPFFLYPAAVYFSITFESRCRIHLAARIQFIFWSLIQTFKTYYSIGSPAFLQKWFSALSTAVFRDYGSTYFDFHKVIPWPTSDNVAQVAEMANETEFFYVERNTKNARWVSG